MKCLAAKTLLVSRLAEEIRIEAVPSERYSSFPVLVENHSRTPEVKEICPCWFNLPPFDYTCWRKQKSNEKSSLEAKRKKWRFNWLYHYSSTPFILLYYTTWTRWLVAWCTWSHWWPSSQAISAWYQVAPMSPDQLLRSNSPRILAMFFFGDLTSWWRSANLRSSILGSWRIWPENVMWIWFEAKKSCSKSQFSFPSLV